MDGEWLISYVRVNYPKIPVVFATAYPEGLDEFNPDAILVKPFTLDRLKETISRLADKEDA
jgi:two-component SAPR family response regulator